MLRNWKFLKNLPNFAMYFQGVVENWLFGKGRVFFRVGRIPNFGRNIYPWCIECIHYWYNWYLQFAVSTLCYDCKEFVLSLFICQVFLYFILSFANVNRKTNCDPSFEMTFSQHRIWFKNTPNLILNNLGSPWTYFCLLKYNEDFSKLEKPIRHFARM